MTKARYLSAWHIFNAASKAGHKDSAAASVVTLVKAALGKPFMADKDVRDKLGVYMQPFIAIIKQAGLTREA
jgi:hypothetical protein